MSRDDWDGPPDDDVPTDDRPPICPACGVTMGLVVEGDTVRHVCLECGFDDDAV